MTAGDSTVKETENQDDMLENADNAENESSEEISADAAMKEESSAETEGSEDNNDDVSEELAKAQQTIKDYWDQIMRLKAEIENNRKRAQRDVENAHKYAVKSFVESLLPVIDSLDMGINASQAENATVDSLREGMEMTQSMFASTLEKNSIESVDPTGEKFDPEKHQAMSIQESEEQEPNTVLTVMQKGYLLNDRLIRPAMVVVSKEKSS